MVRKLPVAILPHHTMHKAETLITMSLPKSVTQLLQQQHKEGYIHF